MQSYATEADRDITLDQLLQFVDKFKIPEGWKFEVKELTEDLTVDPQ